MKEDYGSIVKSYYTELYPKFSRILTRKYPKLRLDETEDIFHDALLAVENNIKQNRASKNSSWANYIITIGCNMASKRMRKVNNTDSLDVDESKTQSIFASVEFSSTDDDKKMETLEVQAIIGREVEHTPEKCHKIIKLFYYASSDLEEIAEEIGLKNAGSVKVTKLRCMKELMNRVKNAVKEAGINI
ncbi:MAG: sigma-70 family RNA polymerase sigma factor [Bacteroidales bacterium]|nr:sigma-70 family RNA polymerase sigma factor [Bacteroidales bacterium]